jgi:hypothetical protein
VPESTSDLHRVSSISTAALTALTLNRELKAMDDRLHECQSKRYFYSGDEEILADSELETTEKISRLDDIFQEYTVSFVIVHTVDILTHRGRLPCINMSQVV